MLRLKFVAVGEEEPINNIIEMVINMLKAGEVDLMEFTVSGGK